MECARKCAECARFVRGSHSGRPHRSTLNYPVELLASLLQVLIVPYGACHKLPQEDLRVVLHRERGALQAVPWEEQQAQRQEAQQEAQQAQEDAQIVE